MYNLQIGIELQEFFWKNARNYKNFLCWQKLDICGVVAYDIEMIL
jgi:hypothetical protein